MKISNCPIIATPSDWVIVIAVDCPKCHKEFATYYSKTDNPERAWEEVQCLGCGAVFNFPDRMMEIESI